MARGGHGAERGGLCASVRGRWHAPCPSTPCLLLPVFPWQSFHLYSGWIFRCLCGFSVFATDSSPRGGRGRAVTPTLQKRKQQSRANGVFRVLKDPSGCDMEAGGGGTGRKERDPGGWCSLSSQGPVAGGRSAGPIGVQTHSSMLGCGQRTCPLLTLDEGQEQMETSQVLTGQSKAGRALIACDQSRAAAVAQPHSALPFAWDGSPGTAHGSLPRPFLL